MTVVVRLPFQKPPLTPNQRLHYAQKAALTAQIRRAATQCARAAKIPPAGRSAVTTVWFPSDKRRRDANGRKCLIPGLESKRGRERANASRPLTHSIERARRG